MFNFYYSEVSSAKFDGYVCNFNFINEFLSIPGVVLEDNTGGYRIVFFRKQLTLNEYNINQKVYIAFSNSGYVDEV